MAQGENPCYLLLNQANRHGLIAGASGTGKTVTFKVMAEGFSQAGPVLLSRLLGLTKVQEGVLNIVFRIADDKQMLLIDMKDLRSMLNYVAEHAKEYTTTYGNVSSQSVGAILRALIAVEDQGGDVFFGEPALELSDWFACDASGRGYVNILNATRLIQQPQIYSLFLLWMLSDLFEKLPEVGDLDKPRFVFFFDEAHLLFNDMPSELLNKLIQVVKLVRSKGVGVYFITQSPSDIPNEVLAQLSNRVQHGLRAYTSAEQKAVRAAAEAFRENPNFKSEDVILELGTGEALVSFLDVDGKPSIVENAKVLPPQCLMAAASEEAKAAVVQGQAALMAKYGTAVDRESAYEKILDEQKQNEAAAELERQRAELEAQKAEFAKQQAAAQKAAEKEAARQQRAAQKEAERQARAAERERQKQINAMGRVATSILGSAGRTAANQIVRGLFGTRR